MFWIYQNASFAFRTHLEPGRFTSGLLFGWLQYSSGFSLSFPLRWALSTASSWLGLWSVWSWGASSPFSWVKAKVLKSAPSLTMMAWSSFQGAACMLPPLPLLFFDLLSLKQPRLPHCRAEQRSRTVHLAWTPFFLKISQLTPVSLSSLSSNLPLSKRLILTNPFCLKICQSVTLFCFSFTYSNPFFLHGMFFF